MRLRLLSMILAMTLIGAALAQDSPGNTPIYTLSCTGAPFSVTAACFIERPVFTIGNFEIAIGIDGRAIILDFEDGFVYLFNDASLAAYGVLAYYAPTWNVWLEVALPEIVPPIGRVDPLRLGFTIRF